MSALLLMGGLEILFIHKYAGYYEHMYVEQLMRDGVFPCLIGEGSVHSFQIVMRFELIRFRMKCLGFQYSM